MAATAAAPKPGRTIVTPPEPRDPNGNTLAYRMLKAEERIAALERHEPAVLAERVKYLAADVQDLRTEVKGLKRNALALGILIVGAVVTDAILRMVIGAA